MFTKKENYTNGKAIRWSLQPFKNQGLRKTQRDKCSLYCELLGKKLSELDEQTQEYAMLEIDKFVYGLKQKKYAT